MEATKHPSWRRSPRPFSNADKGDPSTWLGGSAEAWRVGLRGGVSRRLRLAQVLALQKNVKTRRCQGGVRLCRAPFAGDSLVPSTWH
jgi:hypothetical protein